MGFLLALLLATTDDLTLRKGMPLTEALMQLQRRGVRLVFSSEVVRPDMRVEADPDSADLRRTLIELLASHQLEVVEGASGVWIVVPSRSPPRQQEPEAMPVWAEQIVVHPSRISLLAEDPASPAGLTREEIAEVPHLVDDVFRVVRRLPGTAAGDLSAELNVRGGRRDELLIRLDGLELYDPYHLKEFDNALSIVSASALDKADLHTGTFSVHYGDRMGGVLDMTTVAPAGDRSFRLEASIASVQLEAQDSFRDGKGQWFGLVRRGNTDLLGRAFKLEGPGFWDAFGKLEYEVNPRQRVQIHGLAARDRLDFTLPETKRLRTEYDSSYVWLTHQGSVGSSSFVETLASSSRLARDRRGFEQDEERMFDVRDERDLRVTALTQSWTSQLGGHSLNGGFDVRRATASYDYFSFREFTTPLVAIRAEPRQGLFAFQDQLENRQLSAYASDRIRPAESVTLEAGVRYDRHSASSEAILSPRVSGVYVLAPGSVVRFGWGQFTQSQRIHELMVQDGDPRLYPAERARQWVVGFERILGHDATLPLSSVRLEVYERRIANPRPRYEQVLGPFDAFPEGEFDRIRLEPERSKARGVELSVHGRPTPRTRWWLNYTLATAKDRVDGEEIPRSSDHRHTLNLDLGYRLGRGWNANLAWVYRTGQPTTTIRLETETDPDGEVELIPVLNNLHDERLPDYHRLDLRLRRQWQKRTGTLSFFVDAHNVYSRRNVAAVDVKIDEETNTIVTEPELWPLFFASVGVSWEF